MPSKNLEILKDAIARNAGAVLSLPLGGVLRHFKSRFLSEEGETFWMESGSSGRLLVEQLAGTGQQAGVSFKSGTMRAIFTTRILSLDLDYRVNADTTVSAILMAMPAEVKEVQRRLNYRVAVPMDSGISVKVWRIAGRAYLYDLPMPSQQVKCDLRDLSLGGLGVTFHGSNGQPPNLSEEDRLRVELTSGGTAFQLEGRIRQPLSLPDPDPAILRTGIVFTPLDQDIKGRQTAAELTRLIGQLQRDEVRRLRVGA